MAKRPNMALLVFAFLLLLQMLITFLPNTGVARIRNQYRWIGRPIDWFEHYMPMVSVVHLLSFTLIGFIALYALPRLGIARLFAGLLVFAVLTEALQWPVPGRNPGLADLVANIVGLLIGLGAALVLGKWRGSD